MKLKKLNALLLCSLVLTVPFLLLLTPSSVQGDTIYYKNCTVSSASALTGYQLMFVVYYGSGVDSGNTVYLGGKCASDFSNVWFVAANGTVLPHWIEESVSGDYAKFWVKADLQSGSNVIQIRYGDSSSYPSNGDDVFLFFDDFSGSSLNLTKWTGDTSYASVNGTVLKYNATSTVDRLIYQNNGTYARTSAPAALMARAYFYVGGSGMFANIGLSSRGDDWVSFHRGNAVSKIFSCKDGSSTMLTTNWNASVWSVFEIKWTSSSILFYQNGNLLNQSVTNTTYIPSDALGAYIHSYNGGLTYVDWVALRQFSSSEPTFIGWGSEGTYPAFFNAATVSSQGAGSSCTFSVNVSSINDLHPNGQYIFGTNNSGSWVWDDPVNFTSTPQVVSVTKTLNSTPFVYVAYCWNFTDNGGLSSSTGILGFYTLNNTVYYKNCTVSSSSTLTNYQLLFNVYWGSGTDSGDSVYLGGKTSPSFSDVCFVAANGTVLPHWVEENVTGSYAKFWVKADLQSGSNIIQIRYGGNTAYSSNGDAVFLFFDDFSGSSLNLTKWKGDTSYASVSDGILLYQSTSAVDRLLYQNNTSYAKVSAPSSVMFRAKYPTGAYIQYCTLGMHSQGDDYIGISNQVLDKRLVFMKNGVSAMYATNHAQNVWSTFMINWTSTSVSFTQDGSQLQNSPVTNTTYIPSDALGAYIHSYNGSLTYVDWVAIRRLASSEPTFTSWSNEQIIETPDTASPTYSNLSVDTTAAGKSCSFSITISDDVALSPKGQYVFGTNNTGSWVWDSAVNFTSTPQTVNVTKTLNDTIGNVVAYCWNFTDNAGNSNTTGVQTFTLTDGNAPSIGTVSTTNGLAGTEVELSVQVEDDVAVDTVIFSWNNSGSWVNATATLSGGNYTFTGTWNSTAYTVVSVIVYANDSSDNWAASDMFNFTLLPAGYFIVLSNSQNLVAGDLATIQVAALRDGVAFNAMLNITKNGEQIFTNLNETSFVDLESISTVKTYNVSAVYDRDLDFQVTNYTATAVNVVWQERQSSGPPSGGGGGGGGGWVPPSSPSPQPDVPSPSPSAEPTFGGHRPQTNVPVVVVTAVCVLLIVCVVGYDLLAKKQSKLKRSSSRFTVKLKRGR